MTTITQCADCGRPVDRYGNCPAASPWDLRIMTPPVTCGHFIPQSRWPRYSAITFQPLPPQRFRMLARLWEWIAL